MRQSYKNSYENLKIKNVKVELDILQILLDKRAAVKDMIASIENKNLCDVSKSKLIYQLVDLEISFEKIVSILDRLNKGV